MRKFSILAKKMLKKTAVIALGLIMALQMGGCGQKSAGTAAGAAGTQAAAAKKSAAVENPTAGDSTAAKNTAASASEAAAEAVTAAEAGTQSTEMTAAEAEPVSTEPEEIYLDPDWEYAYESEINSGCAVLYRASENRKDIVIGVNAGHGTEGGAGERTYCHPDHSPKTTGGSTAAGSETATAVSGGMTFYDGTPEREATLQVAQALRDLLLESGYDVLMLRDGDDVQLDNIARTVICNNTADCHIAIHFDGDGLGYDKGAFYISVPEGIKDMDPVDDNWEACDALGENLVEGLSGEGVDIHGGGSMAIDLTQTSYSTIPSVDIELGNQASDLSSESIAQYAEGLLQGIEMWSTQQE